MAKPRKQKETSSLLKALNFIAKIQKDIGTEIQTHCKISNNYITACDGVITAGHKIEEDLCVSPHTLTLLNALSKCGQNLSMTQLENNKLAVKSGKFTALVPCIPIYSYVNTPDNPCASISDVFIQALGEVSHLAQEQAQKVVLASVLMRSGSVMATNGVVALEYWHGIDVPTCALPKVFVTALCSVDKKVTSFGYSGSSITFWFEDESWIKTQLYAEEWPNLDQVLIASGEVKPLPKGFYEALRNVEDFSDGGSEKGTVWFDELGMNSHQTKENGATYEIKDLPAGLAFRIKYLKQIEKACKSISYNKVTMWFFGDSVRGAIMGVR